MKYLSIILLFLAIQANGQIMIGPLTEGEYFNEVVYVGSYSSPGNCTWADGTDFTMNFSGLTEVDGMEYVFIVDPPDPDSTYLLNGWLPVNVGDSTVFTPSTSSIGISAGSGPATLHFHVRLVGIPSTNGQAHPCWIDGAVTEALCDNTYFLGDGESPIPCNVLTSTGFAESQRFTSIQLIENMIRIKSFEQGEFIIHSIDGKLLSKQTVRSGTTNLNAPDHHGLVLIQLRTSNHSISRKILLK